MEELGPCGCGGAARILYTPVRMRLYCNWCLHPYAIEELRLCSPKCSDLYWGVYHKKQEGVANVVIEDECSGCGRKVVADVIYNYITK